MSLGEHLASGATTVARCWRVSRRDGVVLGFTDHDLDLIFDGVAFKAGAGLEAEALSQTTGLAVDNAEASGALSHEAISEVDLRAGRYDGAEVEAWLVNWADPIERALQFRGHLGEIWQSGGAFRAELRGMSEALGALRERVYQAGCSAELGDARCGVDLEGPGISLEGLVVESHGALVRVELEGSAEPRWFERGRLHVLSGAAKGLVGRIRDDRGAGHSRELQLWEELRVELALGDLVRLEPGCDRTVVSCRGKFDNFLNFRGFPDLPTEDWLLAAPKALA